MPKKVVFMDCLIRAIHEELAYGDLCEAVSSEHQAEAGRPEVLLTYMYHSVYHFIFISYCPMVLCHFSPLISW